MHNLENAQKDNQVGSCMDWRIHSHKGWRTHKGSFILPSIICSQCTLPLLPEKMFSGPRERVYWEQMG